MFVQAVLERVQIVIESSFTHERNFALIVFILFGSDKKLLQRISRKFGCCPLFQSYLIRFI